MMNSLPFELVPSRVDHTEAFYELYLRNRSAWGPWLPHNPSLFTRHGQRERLRAEETARDQGNGYAFGIWYGAQLVGRIALTGVERGFFQNAHLGYAVDVAYQGRGLATQATRRVVDFAFTVIRLHRVDAAVLMDNRASMRVLEKVGFRLIGTAPYYLAIGGEWRDHQLYAITLEEANVGESRSNPV
ncbi:Ribosomal-protein-alanine N-acetyltransferase [Sulfobacillus acidophilus TPY]|uniref:GCN5-related N-acetyltransferase n=1 Tax=Sulfobacillus acidophilus (strain ATCC 700253 / DSM 10332 / NAL) TaxID=679936 RepID=G8TSC0_SULAD|nr:Ribosomal-protein-alanine N-acetyltransferase [Sulfobacillus acidophilus TPY]AEW05532.1 GCN5-related N-acetyltransferase [Sulfobacillus acidophilus DSM 10332]